MWVMLIPAGWCWYFEGPGSDHIVEEVAQQTTHVDTVFADKHRQAFYSKEALKLDSYSNNSRWTNLASSRWEVQLVKDINCQFYSVIQQGLGTLALTGLNFWEHGILCCNSPCKTWLWVHNTQSLHFSYLPCFRAHYSAAEHYASAIHLPLLKVTISMTLSITTASFSASKAPYKLGRPSQQSWLSFATTTVTVVSHDTVQQLLSFTFFTRYTTHSAVGASPCCFSHGLMALRCKISPHYVGRTQ